MDQNNPYQMPEPDTNDDSPQQPNAGPQLLAPLYAVKSLIKFLGIMCIIYGIFQCLSIVGAVIGWIPIWIGIKINRTVDLITQSYESGDDSMAMAATEELGSILKIIGIVFLVSLILIVLMIVTYIVIAVLMVGLFASAATGAGS